MRFFSSRSDTPPLKSWGLTSLDRRKPLFVRKVGSREGQAPSIMASLCSLVRSESVASQPDDSFATRVPQVFVAQPAGAVGSQGPRQCGKLSYLFSNRFCEAPFARLGRLLRSSGARGSETNFHPCRSSVYGIGHQILFSLCSETDASLGDAPSKLRFPKGTSQGTGRVDQVKQSDSLLPVSSQAEEGGSGVSK